MSGALNADFVRIAPDVKLGQGVRIFGFVNLYGCSIGDDSRVGAFVEIQKNAHIGAHCKISSHTFICEGVTIEDDCFIGHGVMFINDKFPRATTEGGQPQSESDWQVVPTWVRRGASIGSGAVILCGVTIGERALVGAGAVVTHDVPDGAVVAGVPARLMARGAGRSGPQMLKAGVATPLPRDASAPLLSLVLPGYNEEAAISQAVHTCVDSFRQGGIEDFEIILVNDGSKDRTGERADELARQDSRIRVIHHEYNQGQSAAFLHGFAASRGQIVTWNGMDLPFHPQDVPRAMDCINAGADVVVVERRNRKAYGPVRKIISWSNVLVLRTLFGSPFRDHNFVQFFRREVLTRLPVESRGVSTVSAELIFRAVRAGYRVVPITADYHPRGTGRSTINLPKIVDTLLETGRLWFALRKQARRTQ